RGGENISTAEVEHELEAHPDVRQAVVVGAPDPLMGERVAAFVVGSPTFDVTAARAWFEDRGIARFKTPERVIVVDALPTLPTGSRKGDVALPVVTDGGLLTDPERRLAVTAVADGDPEIHDPLAPERSKDRVVERGARRDVGTLDRQMVEHDRDPTRPPSIVS